MNFLFAGRIASALLLLAFFCIPSTVVYAQESNDGIQLTKKEKKEKAIREGKLLISPYAAPSYSPELSLNLAGGLLFTFRTSQKDTALPRSSAPLSFTISSNGSFILSSFPTTFWFHDKLRINAALQYRNQKDNYFGVGFENGLNTLYPDSTSYKRKYWQLQAKPMYRVSKKIFLGVNLDFNNTVATDVNAHMAKDPDYLLYGPNNYNAGVGLAISLDTRDFPQNAYKGLFLNYTATQFGLFGGDNNYKVSDLEYRQYFNVNKNKPGRIIAVIFKGRYCFDSIPYPELSYVGSPNDIRGYRIGRFRDRFTNFILAEYRHKFQGESFMAERSGFVTWLGFGALAPEFKDSFTKNTLPNIGVGYRFEVQPRLNIRVDFGLGRESNGLYFGFQEAF